MFFSTNHPFSPKLSHQCSISAPYMRVSSRLISKFAWHCCFRSQERYAAGVGGRRGAGMAMRPAS
eukprot:2911411-Rhodomonas_salina.1